MTASVTLPGGSWRGRWTKPKKKPAGRSIPAAPNGSVTTLLTGLRISNGLTWSPDYRTFYFIDTPTRTVMAYDYILETGGHHPPAPGG